jgi:lipoprotein-releasing system ATP-binding protein
MNKKPIIKSQHLYKSYRDGKTSVDVLNGIDFSIYSGERISIVGPSGSGKSTFLHLLGGLDNPTTGEVYIHDLNWQQMNEKQRCMTRNQHLGFVYQFHHLLPEFTALENVALSLLISGQKVSSAEAQAKSMLAEVGLSQRMSHKPSQLSGGERQRVAIARALINKPQCLFADEPTGNLDQATAAKVFELMIHLNTQYQTALVIVTHDLQLAHQMDRTIVLHQGQLVEQA